MGAPYICDISHLRVKSNNRTQVLVRQLMSWHILTLEYSK